MKKLVLLSLIVLMLASCVDNGGTPSSNQMQATLMAKEVTATFAAEQFHAQLTAIQKLTVTPTPSKYQSVAPYRTPTMLFQ